MYQETLTVVARVRDAARARAALSAIASDRLPGPGARPRVFAAPDLGIHFARLVLLQESDAASSATLVFESNFDTIEESTEAARSVHLQLLGERCRETLLSAFCCCEGFDSSFSSRELASALEQSAVSATAAYQGHTQRDLSRIHLERHLREVLLCFFQRAPKGTHRELYRAARHHVRLQSGIDPRLSGFDVDASAPESPDAGIRTQRLNAGIAPWFQNIKPALPIVFRYLRNVFSWQETDQEFDQRARQEAWTDADRTLFREIAETEDHGLQNALTHVVKLKDGTNRLDVLRAAHAYIDVMAKRHFDDIGQLGGIPTIHFAKWLLIEEGRRLLFFSNYDSSWESYLGDFVDQASVGLNLAWTCTELYPRTHLMALLGAKDEERFKAWSRAHQRPTQVFYCAYPDLSIAALNNNTWIRCGLHQPPSNVDLPGWFRRIT